MIEHTGLPQPALTALLNLRDKDGNLATTAVVAAARNEEHPLHGYFEWDDTRAAAAHRLTQAGQLIRRVRVIVNESTDGPRTARALVSHRDLHHDDDDEAAPPGQYRSVESIDVEDRDDIAARIRRDVAELQRKYANYELLWTLLDEMRTKRAS
jgi:hypothetical protein